MKNKADISSNIFKHPFIWAFAAIFIKIILNICIPFTAYFPLFLIFFLIVTDHKKEFIKEAYKGNIYFYIISILLLTASIWFIETQYTSVPLIARVSLIVAFVVQAIDEEVIFRYIFFHNEVSKQAQKQKLVFGSLLFAAIHFTSFPMFFEIENAAFILLLAFGVRMITSMLFGLVFLKHQSLLEVSLLHFVFNAFGANDVGLNFVCILIYAIYILILYKKEIKNKIDTIKAAY